MANESVIPLAAISFGTMNQKMRLDILNRAYLKFLEQHAIKPNDDPYLLLASLAYRMQQIDAVNEQLTARVAVLESEKAKWQTSTSTPN